MAVPVKQELFPPSSIQEVSLNGHAQVLIQFGVELRTRTRLLELDDLLPLRVMLCQDSGLPRTHEIADITRLLAYWPPFLSELANRVGSAKNRAVALDPDSIVQKRFRPRICTPVVAQAPPRSIGRSGVWFHRGF